ncbi:MAG: AmmeMemoRadiSam system protein A [Syntrophomonadaceae bacterium]|nr:AmmeMemoRadiSam system protein A [Syntrophomonadaceae bacterium]
MITYAALTPHPPIIIPEIGQERSKEADKTIGGMQAVAQRLNLSPPDTVIFLTPHGNVFADCITCLIEPELEGNMGGFGHPEVSARHPNDLELLRELGIRAEAHNIKVLGIDRKIAASYALNPDIDHGIMVPLYYLEQAGMGDKPILALSVGDLDTMELYLLGKLIQEAADNIGKKVAVIASGDMSHCLKDEGPYAYHPDGPRFDLMIKDLLARADTQGVLNVSEDLRRNAGECGYRSIVIMLGVMDGYHIRAEVFSYEGPFGVGYLVVGLNPSGRGPSMWEELTAARNRLMESRRAAESIPVKWARLILESHLKGEPNPELPQEMEALLNERAGVFVSLNKHGQLRGCIGTFLPAYANVAQEIRKNALAAGLHDPRFSPVEASELPSLVYSVDILAQPEPCRKGDLDPKRYGVIVSSGSKRGLLLPDLEGVDTVDQQLEIALQKGGISPREKYSIQRFEVKRFT